MSTSLKITKQFQFKFIKNYKLHVKTILFNSQLVLALYIENFHYHSFKIIKFLYILHRTETIQDDIKDALDWLEKNQAPWDLVLEHWKKTSAYRTKALKQSTDKNLVDIFETWKLYKHPSGHELMDADFQCLNLSKVNLDKNIWLKFMNTLQQHTSISSKDETAKVLIESIKSKDVSDGKYMKFIYKNISNYLISN